MEAFAEHDFRLKRLIVMLGAMEREQILLGNLTPNTLIQAFDTLILTIYPFNVAAIMRYLIRYPLPTKNT